MASPEIPDASASRLSDSVYQLILQMVLAGELPAGQPVSELALSRKLGVSRTPVHDAVRKLIEDGFMVQEPNHRPTVATFSADDVADVFEMRKLLESEAARRAATRIDRPTLMRLRRQAAELADSHEENWLERWADFDEAFHRAIAFASGSRRLEGDIARYRLLHRAFNRLHTRREVLLQALAEHTQILDALDARDGDAAAAAMSRHIAEWQSFFRQNFARLAVHHHDQSLAARPHA